MHVLQQLRVSGTSAMLRMVQAAHPTRIPYNELYSRYRAVAPPELAALQPNDFVEVADLTHTHICIRTAPRSHIHVPLRRWMISSACNPHVLSGARARAGDP